MGVGTMVAVGAASAVFAGIAVAVDGSGIGGVPGGVPGGVVEVEVETLQATARVSTRTSANNLAIIYPSLCPPIESAKREI